MLLSPNEPATAVALIGWMSRSQAARAILGREPRDANDAATAEQIWHRCRGEVESRAPHAADGPGPGTWFLPLPASMQSWRESVHEREDVKRELAQKRWDVVLLDAARALAWQRFIKVGNLWSRNGSLATPEDLWHASFPRVQPFELPAEMGRHSITYISDDPNLRVLNPVHGLQGDRLPRDNEQGSPTRGFAGFSIGFGWSFVCARRFRDRVFLVNGYHRAYTALSRGISHIPCILVDEDTEAETVLEDGHRYFPRETLFGSRPPSVGDFLDRKVSHELRVPEFRKMIRVSFDEITVPV